MKKFIVILSALLCLAMLLTACTPKNGDDPMESTPLAEISPTETNPETSPEPLPEELKTDYDAIISQWGKYVSFGDESKGEISKDATLTKILEQNESPDHGENLTISRQGDLILFSYNSSIYKNEYSYEEGDYEDVRVDTYRYNVFNLVSGQEVAQAQYSYRYYPDRGGADCHKYANVQSTPSLSYAAYGIIRMQVTAYTYIPETRDEWEHIESFSRWESQTTYDYYDTNGKILVEGLDSHDFEVVSSSSAYRTILRIGDKYFLAKDGEIVAELGSEMQVRLDFGAEEYNGFQYRWTDSTVRVLDTVTNRITVDWCFADYFDQRDGYLTTYTLGNGNILFQKNCYAWSDEGFQFGYEYYAPIYVLIDARTGEVRDVTPTCTIDGVTYEYIIDSLINNASNHGTGLHMKNDDYQLAEIYLISDGIVAPKTTSVILDSSLQVVEALDPFLQDQAGVWGVLENGDLLIYTDSYTYYSVDVNKNGSQRLLLFVDPNRMITAICGGFLADDGILYNDSLKPLINVSQKYSDCVSSGDGLKAWSDEDRCYHYLSINSAGELVIQYAPETGTYLTSFSYGGCTVYASVNPDAWSGSDVPYVYTVINARGQTIETLYGESCTVISDMLKLTCGSTSAYYILK